MAASPQLPDPVSDTTAGVLQTPDLSLSASLRHNSPKSYVTTNLPVPRPAGQMRGSINRNPPLQIAPSADSHTCPPRQLFKQLQSQRESNKSVQRPSFPKGGGGKNCSLVERRASKPGGVSRGTDLPCFSLWLAFWHDTLTPCAMPLMPQSPALGRRRREAAPLNAPRSDPPSLKGLSCLPFEDQYCQVLPRGAAKWLLLVTFGLDSPV